MGYRELYTYRSAIINVNNPLFEMSKILYDKKVEEGFKFVILEGKECYSVIKELFDISIDAFAGSYLYSDITFDVFEKIYLSWMKNINPTLVMAYYNNQAVGYVFGYENPMSGGFISKSSAVKKEFQKHKVYTALLYLGYKVIIDKGYDEIIYHFQCEQKDNFKKFENNIESHEKRYALYCKEI